MFKQALRSAGMGALASLALAPAALAAGPRPASCHTVRSAPGKHYCTFYVAGNGLNGGSMVLNGAGGRVGYLHQGENWVICQQIGKEASSGRFHNHWWAWTEADNRHWGWVNALWAHGGDNDGQFSGTPGCAGAHGQPPHVSARPPHKPPRRKPNPGPSVLQRANAIMHLSYSAFVSYKNSHHRPAPFDWRDDGCSYTPPAWANLFNQPCQLHDFGYANYGSGRLHLGLNESTRAWVDHRLLEEMDRVCQHKFGAWYRYANKIACRREADVMYAAVRNFGRSAYYG